VRAEQFHLIAKTVADPARIAALQMIAKRGEVSCSDLCKHLELTPATVGFADLNPGDDFKNGFLARAAVKRLGEPDDIAKAAVYFASDDSSWVSGETLVVGGGARL